MKMRAVILSVEDDTGEFGRGFVAAITGITHTDAERLEIGQAAIDAVQLPRPPAARIAHAKAK